MSKLKVFVYGTLKVGGHFAKRFDSRRTDVKKGTISGTMFSVAGHYPAVVLNGDTTISGEIHEYSDGANVETALDNIEGFYKKDHPSNLYNKRKIMVNTKKGKEECIMYEFAKSTSTYEKISSGIWENK